MVGRIATAVRGMVEKTGEQPIGAGAGCPGLIDNKNGVVVVSANLPNLKNFPLADALERQVGLPTAIHNDAKAAMLGEYNFGPNKGTPNMVLLTLGTGVGGGVITGGQLITGADNAATELGHVTRVGGGTAHVVSSDTEWTITTESGMTLRLNRLPDNTWLVASVGGQTA